MPDEPAPYELRTEDGTNQTHIVSIRRRHDDKIVSIHPSDPDFCEFLTWANQQSEPVALTYQAKDYGIRYVATKASVIEECKRRSIVLLVFMEESAKPHLATLISSRSNRYPIDFKHSPQAGSTFQDGNLPFYPLFRAVVPNDESEFQWKGISAEAIGLYVGTPLLEELNNDLQSPEKEIRCLSSWAAPRSFVYVDISGFSQHEDNQQVVILNSLIETINNDRYWGGSGLAADARGDLQQSLCIGDGYIFSFKDAFMAALFAAYLASIIESLRQRKLLPKFHFRMSVHTGPVFRFWDQCRTREGRWNYIGKGITEGERVKSVIGPDQDDIVYMSADTRDEILGRDNLPVIGDIVRSHLRSHIRNRGRQRDKHKKFHRVYEIDHGGWIDAISDHLSYLPEQVARRTFRRPDQPH